MGEPGPFGYDEVWNVDEDFTPHNLAITAGEPLVIVHHQGETVHTLTWDSDHLWFPAVGTTYQATVEVYDMSGSLVVTSPSVNCTLNQQGSWDWHPTFGGPPPGNDADDLYAFRITGQHGPGCTDSDKVDMLAISDVRSRIVWSQHLPPMCRIDIDLALNQASDTIKYSVYDRNLNPAWSGELGAFAAGTQTVRIEFPLPSSDSQLGPYTVLLKTKQADGTGNRDGQPKDAMPTGRMVGFPLSAKYVYIYGDPVVGHAAAGESTLKGWPYTHIFGWYPGNGFPLIPAPGDLECRSSQGDPLTTTAGHHGQQDLQRAFEMPSEGSGAVALRAANYLAQNNPEVMARFWRFVLNDSGGSEDFLGNLGETSRLWDLVGVNCAGFAADVTNLPIELQQPPPNPLLLGNALVGLHANGNLSYVTGWWTDGGALSAHDCAACRQARGQE